MFMIIDDEDKCFCILMQNLMIFEYFRNLNIAKAG